jgi:DmsE family decaheme c-type cytochrome
MTDDKTATRRLVLLSLVAIAAFLAYAVTAAGKTPGDPYVPDAEAEECGACHDDILGAMRNNPHALLAKEGWTGEDVGSCTACHGDASAHLEAGGSEGTISAFDDDELASTNRNLCLACHGQKLARFVHGPHAKGNMDCSDCHSVHSGSPRPSEGDVLRVCYGCHQDAFTSFAFTERHRLQEGILTCTTCHDPHGPQARVRLGGFKQEQCANCHTDKHGPFVFEHPAQRIEGCVACHEPHGSPNRHMLKFQDVADLCFSCHALVPDFHDRFTFETQCTNCHSTIHGSFLDPYFLK